MTPKLTRVVRLDSVPLDKAYYTDEGYLADRPVLTSTGIFEYTNPDGSIRRELRLPEEVFRPESLKSYRGKPIVITHDAGLITKDNVHENSVGTILSEGYRSGNNVVADIVIHDTDAMKNAGLKELSLGYNLDLDETPGVWNGQPYDAIQRNIIINHLALVLEARAGDQARLNIDSRDRNEKGETTMSMKTKKRGRADGAMSPEELNKAIEEYKARRAQRSGASDSQNGDDPAGAAGAPAGKKPNPFAAKKNSDVPKAADGEDEPVVAVSGQDGDDDIEKNVQLVKDRRDRRDAEGDPKDMKSAMGVIAQQDSDNDLLLNIIETLLAKRDFDGTNKCDGDDEEDPVVPAANGNAGSATEKDEDDTVPAFPPKKAEKKPTTPAAGNEDEDDPYDGEEDNTDSDDDSIPNTNKSEVGKSVLNVDSVDSIVRQRIQLGMVGRSLNMDGLEYMPINKAKKAVIKAVRPGLRLDGKSEAYINAAFDCAVDEVRSRSHKGIDYQKRQMFNQDSRTAAVDKDSSMAARQRMIDRQMKKKEDN